MALKLNPTARTILVPYLCVQMMEVSKMCALYCCVTHTLYTKQVSLTFCCCVMQKFTHKNTIISPRRVLHKSHQYQYSVLRSSPCLLHHILRIVLGIFFKNNEFENFWVFLLWFLKFVFIFQLCVFLLFFEDKFIYSRYYLFAVVFALIVIIIDFNFGCSSYFDISPKCQSVYQ